MKDKLKGMGIEIKNESLLKTALTHTSYSNEHNCESYERLEFLGDAVLELISSEYFYNNTKLNEGEMSKTRASFVCEEALFQYAKDIDLKKYILVGHGQESNINATIIADVFESVLAVIYLETGFDKAREYVLSLMTPYILRNYKFICDYKSLLQELVQTDKKSLEYVVVNETGPAHDKRFTVEVRVDDMIYGKGTGKSKKEAEQNAARSAYQKRSK